MKFEITNYNQLFEQSIRMIGQSWGFMYLEYIPPGSDQTHYVQIGLPEEPPRKRTNKMVAYAGIAPGKEHQKSQFTFTPANFDEVRGQMFHLDDPYADIPEGTKFPYPTAREKEFPFDS